MWSCGCFVFKQKTAYEMRISDWSSDVCSSDRMTQFMRWYAQAGTPEVTVKTRYDEEKRTYTIALKQIMPRTPGQPEKQPMLIPLRMGLVDRNGTDLPIDGKCVV